MVLQDQAGFHLHPELHDLPARIHVISLPPYSPELNPAEAIGDLIKDRVGNTLWKSLGALEKSLGEELRPLYENAEQVRSLVSHGWLLDQVNVTEANNSASA